jgi:predicted  nucleic acid-binding Zn-ribbon protein
MPHRCTRCGKIYEDGDMRILNGCECGNNKFEYIPRERKEKKEGEKIEIVRIISPGCYEINLENAFKKEGIIIALGEEGKYAIHLPSLLKRRKKS